MMVNNWVEISFFFVLEMMVNNKFAVLSISKTIAVKKIKNKKKSKTID